MIFDLSIKKFAVIPINCTMKTRLETCSSKLNIKDATMKRKNQCKFDYGALKSHVI
jgi:hypothetical protein